MCLCSCRASAASRSAHSARSQAFSSSECIRRSAVSENCSLLCKAVRRWTSAALACLPLPGLPLRQPTLLLLALNVTGISFLGQVSYSFASQLPERVHSLRWQVWQLLDVCWTTQPSICAISLNIASRQLHTNKTRVTCLHACITVGRSACNSCLGSMHLLLSCLDWGAAFDPRTWLTRYLNALPSQARLKSC